MMEPQQFDWTSFRQEITLAGNSQVLFDAWSTSQGIESWFMKKAIYYTYNNRQKQEDEQCEAGDRYYWQFHNGKIVEGTITGIEKNKLLQFNFGENEPGSKEHVIVTVKFRDNLIELVQENMRTSNYGKIMNISCNMGWTFHLNNLRSVTETNHDLRFIDEKKMHVDAPSGHSTGNYCWTKFKLTETFSTDVDSVFKYWSTADNLSKWWVKSAKYCDEQNLEKSSTTVIQSGDLYEYQFKSKLIMKGKILEVIPNKLVKFTFGVDPIVVSVQFSELNKTKTKITLIQEGIPNSEYHRVNYNLKCIVGWSHYLTNLRSIIESGLDLRS